MFKVISSAEAKEAGYWEIENTETGDIVACITTFQGFRKSIKQLKVNDKIVCDVKNQDEAVVKLIKFFDENKRAISTNHTNIAILEDDLKIVSDLTKDLITKEIERIQKVNENLEKYNLV